MKKCIVLSGQYRTFDQTCDNIQKFVEANDLDVYCHLWTDEDDEVSKYQFDKIVEKLNPKRILQQSAELFDDKFKQIERNILESNPKNPNTDRLIGNASMNYSRKAAFDLIEDEYDVLVYCRYDIGFHNVFQFQNVDILVTPLEESYNLISDIFAIMPFGAAKYYFLFDEYEKLHSTQFEPEFEEYLRNTRRYGEENIRIHKEDRYCPHMMLLRHIYMNGIRQVSTNQLSVYIQR
jgi:hypothetical protein